MQEASSLQPLGPARLGSLNRIMDRARAPPHDSSIILIFHMDQRPSATLVGFHIHFLTRYCLLLDYDSNPATRPCPSCEHLVQYRQPSEECFIRDYVQTNRHESVSRGGRVARLDGISRSPFAYLLPARMSDPDNALCSVSP